MKYIRTKDGIYPSDYAFEIKYILNQADTIEELCDEFVVCNSLVNTLNTAFSSRFLMKELNGKDVEIYGAIWTDKGLIYVAKINDKGELELL